MDVQQAKGPAVEENGEIGSKGERDPGVYGSWHWRQGGVKAMWYDQRGLHGRANFSAAVKEVMQGIPLD